jgi:branched-chain amino acid transport system permease protein
MLRRGVREEAFVVATLGFSLVIEQVLQIRTQGVTETFPAQNFPQGIETVWGLIIPDLYIIIFGLSVAIAVAVMLWLSRTKSGKAFRTVAYSPDVATILGINPRTIYSLGFAISGGLAAVAGLFVAADTNIVSYSMGDPLLLTAFAVIIVGGMGSAVGALVGGMTLGVAEVFVGTYISSAYQPAVTYGAILVFLVVRPNGLFGQREMARV